MTKYADAIARQEETGGLWDENGAMVSSEAQEVIDRIGPREWTGSPADWRLCREMAQEMDDADTCPRCGCDNDSGIGHCDHKWHGAV